MSEEDKAGTPALGPQGQPEGVSGRIWSDREQYAALRWTVWIGAIGAAGAAAFNVLLYFQSGAWQMLGVAGGSAVAVVCLAPAWLLGRRKRFDAAGYWALGGMMIAFAAGELLHTGLTPLLVAGGALLALTVGNLLLPRQRWVWIGAAGLFIAYSVLIHWWEPLPRFDMRQLGALSDVFTGGLVAFLVVAALFGIVRYYRQIAALRVRLTVSFAVVALLPVIAIVIALSTVGLRTSRQQVIDRLETVVVLKEAEIENWVENLQIDLDVTLEGQQVVSNWLALGQEPEGSAARQAAAARLRERLGSILEQTGRLEEMFLMDLDGRVLVSTDVTREGQSLAAQLYFHEGLESPYVQPPRYSVAAMRATLFVARPVQDAQGQTVGVLVGQASLSKLDELMAEQVGLGETGETYLVGGNRSLLTPVRFGRANSFLSSDGVDDAVGNRRNDSGFYDRLGVPVVGAYRWLPDLQVALVAEQEQSEALSTILTALGLVASITLVGVLAAVGVALLVTRSIARPLTHLTETMAQVAAGNLTLAARVEREDEVGILARAFNSMTAQIRDLIGGLEQRVADRTVQLEQRSRYLEASAEVGRAAGSILEPDDLIRQVVDLIRERFGLYYVGLFLLDKTGEWAELRAGTGEAGRAMLSRGHRIRLGEGMIGWSAARGEARVAGEAGADAVRLATPELPETRSEAALPLRSRGRVLGALTVQHTQPGAFDADTMAVLQTMADQVAVALDNARLFAESQEALEAERRAYGEISREAWLHMIRGQEVRGYRSDGRGVFALTDDAGLAARQEAAAGSGGADSASVSVPVPVRDQIVGTLSFRKAGTGQSWSAEEVEFLQGMGKQLGLALESARLYEDTQRRAAQEQLLGKVTARVRETLDVDTVLQTAIREMGTALGIPRVEIRMGGALAGVDRAREQSGMGQTPLEEN